MHSDAKIHLKHILHIVEIRVVYCREAYLQVIRGKRTKDIIEQLALLFVRSLKQTHFSEGCFLILIVDRLIQVSLVGGEDTGIPPFLPHHSIPSLKELRLWNRI